MESYLAKELEVKLKFEELQKDIIELKAQIKSSCFSYGSDTQLHHGVFAKKHKL